MMEKGFKSAKLVLDEPRALYYSGQVLSGYIECESDEPTDYVAINVNYTGRATVHWTAKEIEEYNGVRRNVVIKYSSDEEYFNVTQCVAGGIGVSTLAAGQHRFPFKYLIPSTAPSSFSGKYGQVSYKLMAYINYPYAAKLKRDELSTHFDVVAPMDLNKCGEHVQRPLDLDIEQVYSSCCSCEPLSIHLNLPAAGYCPGQAIPIRVEANNRSSYKLKGLIFELIKRTGYKSTQPISEFIPPEEVLVTAKPKPILAKTYRNFTVDLVVPDMIAPNLGNCSIISVRFFLRVTFKVPDCNDDYVNETEIYIGLVPISSLVQCYVHPLQKDLPTGPIPASTNIQLLQNNENQNNSCPYPNNGNPQISTGYPTSDTVHPTPNIVYPTNTPYPPPGNTAYPPENPAYPIASTGYPNANPPYPSNDIPLNTIKTGNIGFVITGTPPANSGSGIPPYPMPSVQGYTPVPTAPPPS